MGAVLVRWAEADAHDLLRHTVAERAGVAAAEVEVGHRCATCGGTSHGRITVAVAGGPGPFVSLSRAGTRSIVAVADRPVGIDLEQQTGEGDDLAHVVLSPSERPGQVLQAWVRKEAILKALGLGLVVDPSLLTLSMRRAQPRLVGWDGPGRRPAVRLRDVDVGVGYVAAVARAGRRAVRISG